ncbi:PREDICTED: uncharacterized protein LOC106111524 [Papilio polytes]|uniref:uncharacterized protein LOC106111524 n=1 Tax=Papilio polytes TaxID=76194 RepID=UPI00067692E0|nr:PREDICTED: uncharacterized protein LOC106111524 [Papilio polytes]
MSPSGRKQFVYADDGTDERNLVDHPNEWVNKTSDFERNESTVLSRRKRFIVFPEGSSFQVVFCVTYPMLTTIGDIFLFGNTAALAFELPQDPYSPFNHRADPLHRRMDSKTIYFTDYDGKVVHKAPYKRRPIVNPAFAKRSVDSNSHQNGANVFKIDRREMHASQREREFLKSEQMETASIEFHRSGRAALYQKIETMLQGFGGDGTQCLLKTLCLVAQSRNHPQGDFLQEILRAVFTLPQSNNTDEYLEEYDMASKSTESCDKLYPHCNERLANIDSPTFNY